MRKKNTMFRRKKLVTCSRRRQITKQLHRKLTSRRQRYQTQLDTVDFSDINLQNIHTAAFDTTVSTAVQTTTGAEAI